MAVVNVDDKNFQEEVLKSKLPVVADFWAQWCAPCKRVAPILEEIANEYKGKIKVAKIDVDQANASASRYGVMSVPTIMIFDKGKVLSQSAGAISKNEIKSKIADVLSM